MQNESDSNVMYGGGIDAVHNISYNSLGEMIVTELKKGLDKPAFVSSNFTRKEGKNKLN